MMARIESYEPAIKIKRTNRLPAIRNPSKVRDQCAIFSYVAALCTFPTIGWNKSFGLSLTFIPNFEQFDSIEEFSRKVYIIIGV